MRRRACRTNCIATARTCVRHLPGNLLAAIQRILFFRAGAYKYALRTSTSATTFPLHSPVAISDTLLSAPQATVSTLATLALRVSLFHRDPPRAHVGLPWLSLVGLRPSCLVGRLSSLAQAHLTWESRVQLVATNVFHLLTSCLGSGSRHSLLLSSQCHRSHKLNVTCSFVFCRFRGQKVVGAVETVDADDINNV